MIETVFPVVAGALVAAMCLAAWRLARGPGMADRVLGLDTLYIVALALLVLLGLRFETAFYFEAALLIAMLGFVGTVVLSKYLERGDVIE